MGTWDIGFFDNDMACDWENGIEKNRSLSYIENTLNSVLEDSEDTLDIDLGNRGLAAAESLARLLGSTTFKNSYTEHIDKWAEEFNEEIPSSLIEKAINALGKILEVSSEVKQFWKIRGELNNWKPKVIELKKRLSEQYEKTSK